MRIIIRVYAFIAKCGRFSRYIAYDDEAIDRNWTKKILDRCDNYYDSERILPAELQRTQLRWFFLYCVLRASPAKIAAINNNIRIYSVFMFLSTFTFIKIYIVSLFLIFQLMLTELKSCTLQFKFNEECNCLRFPSTTSAFSVEYFFASRVPSSSTFKMRLHPLIESMLPDARAIRGRYSLISRFFLAAVLHVWKADIAIVAYAHGH